MEENVYERFKIASESDKFPMSDELNIIKFLIDKYKFMTLSDYARLKGITPAGASKRIEAKRVMTIEIAGLNLIISE
jgi:hypothetical protein